MEVSASAPRGIREPSRDLPPLRIVSYSATPIVGVPAILARCINARTHHTCHCIQGRNISPDGVPFDSEILWDESPEGAEQLLRDADLVIVHNGRFDPGHKALLDTKAVITMAHLPVVDDEFLRSGFPGVVVGQYHVLLPHYRRWPKVPNPVPIWEPDYQPGPKPKEVTVCYTPAARHERYPPEHRLFWHAKGYATTMKILKRLAGRYSIRLEVVGDRYMTHPEALAAKQRSHIVIDECVTGSYHRNSLEGLAAGCVVVNALGILAGVPEAFRYCAGYAPYIPFVQADLERLEEVLEDLICAGAEPLETRGAENRRWMEQFWDFGEQWERYWVPVVRRALRVSRESS